MAGFDLYRAKPGQGCLLVVQSHFHDGLSTRVVVPVLPKAIAADLLFIGF